MDFNMKNILFHLKNNLLKNTIKKYIIQLKIPYQPLLSHMDHYSIKNTLLKNILTISF